MTRVISGAVMALLAIAAVWFAPPLLFLVIAQALVVLAVSEYVGLVVAKPGRAVAAGLTVWTPLTLAMLVTTVTSSLALALGRAGSPALTLVLVGSVVVLGVVTMAQWDGGPGALVSVAVAAFPALYIGLPIAALVLIREHHGARGLFLLMLTVMISDTAQYYTGRALGRHPLAARISPRKTREGAVGGFVFGALAFAAIGAAWLPQPALSWPVRLLLGAAIVAAGIAGDLFESMLKRSAGVKDSSSLIPGHGGVLDRIDALLFTAPVYFAALTLLRP